ncbi:glutathione S-transferase class-mu 26 kDa isozyme 47 [Galendromus occidentalis]|uniref:glutathione transferase n=1 Tax=Galendromus occidentalis TaxID=34638 RepID=A0AAJ6QMF7_9ACAR|nr:glutathione S-transferase class-mu 26 kDa isozyme 47-like [Galendromus occidentalis]XP_018497502.1 glutathione S-transferase class-mu 26 kDa isozyme 47 [Galendromus occidentalis]
MPKLILGYWKLRGLFAPIQYLLEVSGLEYELVAYEFDGGASSPEFRNRWFEVKNTLGFEFPNLPYLIDGDFRLTQSTAILKYIARKAGLLGIAADASPEEHAKLDMIENQVDDLRWFYVHYGIGSKIIDFRFPEGYPASIPRQLESVAAWLKDKFFLMGDNICYVDLILYETLDVQKMINPDSLAKYPNLVAYVERIENLPAMKKFLASPERITWPVLGPIADTWGFKKD